MIKIYIDKIDEIYNQLITYAFKKSDAFSLVYSCVYPFGKILPNYVEEQFAFRLQPFIIKQILRVKEWPGERTKDKNRILNLYKCNKDSKSILLSVDKISSFRGDLPEDLCFFSENKNWFATVNHEGFCLSYDADDEVFFSKLNVDYVKIREIEKYSLDY